MGLDIVSFKGLFSDLPSRQLKVQVRDKHLISNTYDQTRVTHPLSLQNHIDLVLSKHTAHSARAFIRPSGTEDIVRLYVEASNQ